MARFQLHTLGAVSLTGAEGAVALDEPRLVAMIVLLALAHDNVLAEDELLFRLTPSSTPTQGRAELARLAGIARARLGGDESLRRTSNDYVLAPGLIEVDVDVLTEPVTQECSEFLRDFELPASPEFREWVASMRRCVVPRARASNASRKVWLRRGSFVGAAIVLALGWYVVSAGSTSGFSTGDPLLLADVRNETGDSVFDVSLTNAAAIALQQSGRLQLYPRTRLAEVYRLMQVANRDTALTFALAKEVAQRDGVRFVLGLQIDRATDGYRVSAKLADVSSPDRVTTSAATARSKADVLAALDEVLLATRRRLGETAREMEDRRAPLLLVTTTSLEALRSYSDGTVAWAKGDYRLARDLWHRAVDIDTGFAMAYGSLGSWYYYNHNRAEGERYFGEAFKRAGRLSERERLRLRESAAGYRGQQDSAIVFSGLLASRYPAVTTWYAYGTQLMTAHRDSEAIVALKTSLRYDPKHATSFINLATASRHLRRTEDALAYYARAGEADSTILYRNNINIEWGGTLVELGRYAEAESAFTRMSRAPRVEDRALGLRSLGYLALWRGRVEEGAAFFQQATEATIQVRSSLSQLRNRLLAATAQSAMGHEAEANAELTSALALTNASSIEPQALALVATVCVKLERPRDAQMVLGLLRSRVNPTNPSDGASEAYVRGLVALAAHQPDSALRYARAASDLPFTIQRLSLEAEAFRQLRQYDSARVSITRLGEQSAFGREGQDDWLRAPLVLGDILLAQRDTAGAVREYQRILNQARGASSATANVRDARARLDALRRVTVDRPHG